MMILFFRTPTISIGERMLIFGFKNNVNTVDSILEFGYPEWEKKIQDIMKDMHWNAERIILTIKNVRSLNGLFGLQYYSSDTNNQQEEIMQLWYARSFNNCNLVEMHNQYQIFWLWVTVE